MMMRFSSLLVLGVTVTNELSRSVVFGIQELEGIINPTRKLQDTAEEECANSHGTLDFIVLQGDANHVAIEDDIRGMLKRVGFEVNTRLLEKEEWNAAFFVGDYHLSFDATWGAPYDPHAYAQGWTAPDNALYHAFEGFEPPASRDELYEMIDAVFKQEDLTERAKQWEDIHNYYHQQATVLGLWGRRIPTVMNDRLTGYEAGFQEFDYPVHKITPLTGSTTVTISPGGQGGLFQSVGRMDPHTYRPNEFFSNNWIYQGLVEYGQDGQILPQLATTWSLVDTPEGGQEYTFTLREGVQFHDGHPWNCEAAKLNFDHAMAKPLTGPDWHGWHGLPLTVQSWECRGDYEFVVTTKDKYYPFLQELTFIRPFRMLSPTAFVNGPESDPTTHNSCHAGWGNVTDEETGETITCVGIANVSGTGPWMFVSRDTVPATDERQEYDREVVFHRNDNYWGQLPAIETLRIVHYETSDEVKDALLDGSLDLVWGNGVLRAPDLDELDETQGLLVFHSNNVQNNILILNSGKPPLDSINLRKTIIHAIDKKAFIDKELGSVQRPVDNVFPLDAPYCDVDLTPKWDYDLEKAILLGCSTPPPGGEAATTTSDAGGGAAAADGAGADSPPPDLSSNEDGSTTSGDGGGMSDKTLAGIGSLSLSLILGSTLFAIAF